VPSGSAGVVPTDQLVPVRVVDNVRTVDKNLRVIDAATEEIVWSLFDRRNESPLEGVRPIAFETNPDGSTKRLFVQISEFNGFVVIDFATRSEVRRIALPDVPVEEQGEPPFNGAPAHGIGVAPNGETLWVASRINGYVYAYSLPEVEFLGGVRVGSHPDWLTFTPDSRFVYVANGHSDDVSIVDVAARREIKRLDVGSAPKRNIATVLP
jgi:YVTN family beta-propeller protein